MSDEFAKDYLILSNMLLHEKGEDRVAAIVSAAYLEKYLAGVIAQYFPNLADDAALRKAMFDDTTGMAGTLGRKLHMAYALNAITPGTFRSGVLISRIRNKFAHNLDVTSFEHPWVRDLTDNLWKEFMVNREDDKGLQEEAASWDRAFRFRYVASSLCSTIVHHHIKEYPFSFSDPQLGAFGTGARPPLLDKLNKPPRREGSDPLPDPEDQQPPSPPRSSRG
jgi:hypothetical protein